MIKKIITLVAVFSMVSVSAAMPQRNLENAVRNFNFALTVEWDQVDKDFYRGAVDDFQRSIAKLSKEGMGQEDLIKGILVNIKNKRIANDLIAQMDIIDSEQMSSEEAISYVTEKIRFTQAEGANFFGGTARKHLIVLGLIAAVLIVLHCNNGAFDNSKCWEFRDSDL